MDRLKYYWLALALAPLIASKVNAQPFGAPIDLLAPIQEGIIQDLQRGNGSKPRSSASYRSSEPPKFIQALRECDNDAIKLHIQAGRVVENVLFTRPNLLRRARQCGAISSARLEQLLNYQRRYFNIDSPTATNQTAPPRHSQSRNLSHNSILIKALENCDKGIIQNYVSTARWLGKPIQPSIIRRARQCGAL